AVADRADRLWFGRCQDAGGGRHEAAVAGQRPLVQERGSSGGAAPGVGGDGAQAAGGDRGGSGGVGASDQGASAGGGGGSGAASGQGPQGAHQDRGAARRTGGRAAA